MNDLISRQAAIEAASYECGELRGVFGRIEERLKALPSTQPEIVRCKDCVHYDLAKNGYNGNCNRQYAVFTAYDFCSYGERRGDED